MIQRLLNGILDRRTTFPPPLKTTFSSVSSPRIRGHKRHSNLGELSWNKRGLAALAVIGRHFLPSLGNRGGVGLMIHLYQLCIAICSPCLSHMNSPFRCQEGTQTHTASQRKAENIAANLLKPDTTLSCFIIIHFHLWYF